MYAHPDQWRTAAIAAMSDATSDACARAWVARRLAADPRFSRGGWETRVRACAVDAVLTLKIAR